MTKEIIHELKPKLDPSDKDNEQPEVDAVSRKLFMDVAPSIVKINLDDGSGSGFAIDKDGDIATDAHVVLGSKHLTVVTSDGKSYNAKIKALDDLNDLAIIKIDGEVPKTLKPLELGDSKTLKPDDNVWGFGHPNGWDPMYVSPGYFRNTESGQDVLNAEGQKTQDNAKKILDKMTPKEREESQAELKRPMFNALVNIQHGSSGGPIVDRAGKVVGIADLSNLDSDSDFTPVETLKALMNEKTPKFTFNYKTIDNKPTLTDITRTTVGDYRPPFEDKLIVQKDDKFVNPKPNSDGKTRDGYYNKLFL
ncbi:MAG TPA: serine protease [Drouetiella sp.]